MMPAQKPGKSRQDYQTPPDFINAVLDRLDTEFETDLAASEANTVVPHSYWTEEVNALRQDWSQLRGWNWCNPPYSNIEPWVCRAYASGAKIAMLVPASVGANWWRDCVDGKAHVLFLNGRLTFVGETAPYPKDCALLLYTPFIKGGYEVWNWRK